MGRGMKENWRKGNENEMKKRRESCDDDEGIGDL